MNKIILLGRLTADPVIRYTAGENARPVATLTLAVHRDFKSSDGQDTDFIHCYAYGKNAETMEKYLTKGRQILVSGRLAINKYVNKAGQQVYSPAVCISEFHFTDSRSDKEKSAVSNNVDINSFMTVEDGLEELPFN